MWICVTLKRVPLWAPLAILCPLCGLENWESRKDRREPVYECMTSYRDEVWSTVKIRMMNVIYAYEGLCTLLCTCVCVNVWDVYMCARQLKVSFLKDCLPCFSSWFLSGAWRLPSQQSCLASSFGDPLAPPSSTGTADSCHHIQVH